MPSLNERREDILLFANFFLDQANKELDKNLIGFDAAANAILQNYSWPGNLRQLKNIVKRATLLARGEFITPVELGDELTEHNNNNADTGNTISTLNKEEAEKQLIINALKQTANNKSKAAAILGIDRKTLYNKLKHNNIPQ